MTKALENSEAEIRMRFQIAGTPRAENFNRFRSESLNSGVQEHPIFVPW